MLLDGLEMISGFKWWSKCWIAFERERVINICHDLPCLKWMAIYMKKWDLVVEISTQKIKVRSISLIYMIRAQSHHHLTCRRTLLTLTILPFLWVKTFGLISACLSGFQGFKGTTSSWASIQCLMSFAQWKISHCMYGLHSCHLYSQAPAIDPF